ncbi:undecaprenyl-diphosphate phosphatase [Cytobacillus sp. Hz8]|uniref:undecaprenyl-diphosphate phosphatase n=1 Tax=Cytobacillus sp. Hz8 TaxID=3347168 RepID=UPI0035D89339
MKDIIIGFIMGIVEGLTEFAPVSSTGHLILVGHLIGFEGTNTAKTFEIVIQLGSILAVAVVFWKRILGLIGIGPDAKSHTGKKHQLSLIHILIGILPFMIGGVLFHHFIKEVLFSSQTVVIGLIAGGILMILAEKMKKNHTNTMELDKMSYRQAFIMGIFQCLALWPGFSRSGSTISAGLISGLNHKTASEFTFIMALPIMAAATGKDLLDSWSYLSVQDLPLFITGFITAFVVALLAIKFFLQLINKVKLIPFAIYRFILAIAFWIFIL